jgi:hypothetical protein
VPRLPKCRPVTGRWRDEEICEKDGNRDVRIPIAGVEDAGRLARTQSAVGKSAPAGDITLTDGPPTPSMNDLTHVHQATASRLLASSENAQYSLDSTDVELRFVDVGQTNNWNKKAMFVLRTRRGETCTLLRRRRNISLRSIPTNGISTPKIGFV